MNALNRVVLVILFLVVGVLCSVLLVVPVPVLEAVARQAEALAGWLDNVDWYGLWLPGILFAVVVDLVLIFFIFLEVRRPPRKPIRVEQASGGDVLISVTSIADRLRYEVDQLPGILRVKSRVWGKRRGVAVELDVETAAGTDVPGQADQVVGVARRVVEENMGLKLARPPKVNLRVVPYPATPKPRASVRPVPARVEEKSPIILKEEPPSLPEGTGERFAAAEDAGEAPVLPEDAEETS